MDFSRYSVQDVAGYNKRVKDVKWNTEGKYFLTASSDHSARVGQLDNSGATKHVHTIPFGGEIEQTFWNPAQDNRFAIIGEDKTIELWDVRASRPAYKIMTTGSNVFGSWSRCGNYIVSVNKNDLVSLIDVREGRVISKRRFPYQVNDLAWSANSDYFLAATGSEGAGAVDLVWAGGSSLSASSSDVAPADGGSTGQPPLLTVVESLSAHAAICCGLGVDSRYSRMAVGSLDYCFSVWDLENLICKHTRSMDSQITGVSFSGDGRYLAVFSDDPFIMICDSDSGEGLCKVPVRNTINSIAWNPKHNLIAVGLQRSNVSQFVHFITFPSTV